MHEPLPKGFTRNDAPTIALTVLTLALAWRLFRFFMLPWSLQVNFDEGCEAATVERVIGGHWLPYVDAASIRGPFLYWTQGILHVLTGRYEFTGTRWLALLCAFVTVLATFLGGWAAGWALAGAIGGALYIFVIATFYAPGGGMGVVGESVGIAYVTTAFCVVSYALYRARSERGRSALLAIGGCVVGMAGLTKQTEAITCVPLFIWIFARSWGESDERQAPDPARWSTLLLRRLLPFGAGGLALVALVLLRYAVAGKLADFFFWSVSFGAKVYMQPFAGKIGSSMYNWFIAEPWAILGVALALAVALARPLSAMRGSLLGLRLGLRSSAFELCVGLMALLSLAAAALPLRIWPHYFMPIYPFFGLTLGVLIERSLRRGVSVPWQAQCAVVAALGWLLFCSASKRLGDLNHERLQGGWPNPRPEPACAEIDRIAGPEKRAIFIWGTAGDLYITCQRPSASMFTSTMIIAGIVPPSWTPEPDRVAPGIQETLLHELETSKPPVLIDHSLAPGAMMMDFPIYSDLVDASYCKVSTLGDNRGRALTFYARKDLAACKGSTP